MEPYSTDPGRPCQTLLSWCRLRAHEDTRARRHPDSPLPPVRPQMDPPDRRPPEVPGVPEPAAGSEKKPLTYHHRGGMLVGMEDQWLSRNGVIGPKCAR